MRRLWILALVGLSVPASLPCRAATNSPPPGTAMDYGPFLTSSLDRDPAASKKASGGSTEQTGKDANHLAAKSVNVKLRVGDVVGGVAFDTDLLRYVGPWTGGFLELHNTHLTTEKGSVPPSPAGAMLFESPQHMPGWAVGDSPKFDDPRPHPFGPLPKDIARYEGLYRYGDRVVFRYRVGDVDVLDSPQLLKGKADGPPTFMRTIRLSPGNSTVATRIFAKDAFETLGNHTGTGGLTTMKYRDFSVGPREEPREFILLAGANPLADPPTKTLPAVDELTHGGPELWPRVIQTETRVETSSDKPYVVDELTLPNENPWHSWMRPTGFDFFADGTRAAVCTWNGDVWVVSGIGSNPEKLNWKRFAAGLYEPLGVRIVNDVVYATCRDQIVRLRDLNNDGEADFYECFNNDGVVSANYHGFAMELQTDAAGNFYYTRCGQKMSPELPLTGSLIRVSADGSKSEVVACGLRAANGLGVGPHGEITAADNQGNWVPACRINLVKPGGFYGYMPHVRAAGGPDRKDYDPPLCWLPMSVDPSSGSQTWVPEHDTRWGPLAGKMLHTSYGSASLMLVMIDEVDGVAQAGVYRFPLSFPSGVMRARFNPRDGQLYLCGIRAWQTRGAQDGLFCRVRYSGKPVAMPCSMHVVPGGLEIAFTQPLDPDTANDPDSFAAEQWNYRWTEAYGSPEYSVKDPKKPGHDDVTIKSAKLKDDGRTVFLAIPELKPVMQMAVKYDLDTKGGGAGAGMKGEIYLTINRVPEKK
jgi:hypothetical protein